MSETQQNPIRKEHKVVTGRSLESYCYSLMFQRKLLENNKILNVGSGASNLKRQLPLADITETDIDHDPYFAPMTNPIGSFAARVVKKINPSNFRLKRKLAGIDGRIMIQTDARKLPYKDNEFDITLALCSLHQIPKEQRIDAFRELVRVTKKAIHIYPIFSCDMDSLKKLHQEMNCTILFLNATPRMFEEPIIDVGSDQDYKVFLSNNPKLSTRVFIPPVEDVKYKANGRLAVFTGAYTLIICKDDFLAE